MKIGSRKNNPTCEAYESKHRRYDQKLHKLSTRDWQADYRWPSKYEKEQTPTRVHSSHTAMHENQPSSHDLE
jgi:hypothetical protein